MQPPDGNTVIAWGTAIATLIIVIRQQINASAGKKRGEEQASKINDIHATSTNGQIEILRSRALGLRTLATVQPTSDNQNAATKAENDLVLYLKSLGGNNESEVNYSSSSK